MKNVKISIIIPTYNRAHLIGETLESVINQTYANWECLVVDDGSNDYTEELMNFYSSNHDRIFFFKRPLKDLKGANSCRNHGLEMSNGDYVYFFDSDDLMAPTILEKTVDCFKSCEYHDFIFFNYKVFEHNRGNIIVDQINKSKKPFYDYFKGDINLATLAVIWKKKSISGIWFDPRLAKSQELNFVFNLFKNKYLSGTYLNEYGFSLRKHQDSIMSSFWRFSQSHLYSDILVRSNIINYFLPLSQNSIVNYQYFQLKKTLRIYLKECDIVEFCRILKEFKSKDGSLLKEKFSITFLKVGYKLTNREFRFDKAISNLLSKDLVFSFES